MSNMQRFPIEPMAIPHHAEHERSQEAAKNRLRRLRFMQCRDWRTVHKPALER
jgi:hypothetical protein